MDSIQKNQKKEAINNKKIVFLLNGEKRELTIPPGMTLLEMLHEKLNLYGTKSTCNEGDCGACTVIIGRREKESGISYRAVNSCIYPAARIHNKHLITIEGVGSPDKLHPVQEALLDYHGTQCGYCTPGFVMAIIALFSNNPKPEKEDIFASLEGNLCRCTGYDAIMQATLYLKEKLKEGTSLLPAKLTGVEEKIGRLPETVIDLPSENREMFETVGYLQPCSVEELSGMLARFEESREYGFVNGATDLLVQANVSRIFRPWLIDVAEIPELRRIELENNKIFIGAAATLSELTASPVIKDNLPVLVKTVSLMASSQIRNMATIGGNIGNASPVADTPPVLMVLESELELTSAAGVRIVKMSDYYLDYKKTVLKTGEFISGMFIPLLKDEGSFTYRNMKKASKRRAVDISTVNSAVSLQISAGRLKNVRLAYGGVAVYPALAKETMKFMEGRELDPAWFEEAAEKAVAEFKPISDVRGRDEYRRMVIGNHLLGYLGEVYGGKKPADE